MLAQEVISAVRGVRANKAFTAIAVSCLALGIAANVAIFSVFDSVMLQPLPFAQAEQLVSVFEHNVRTGRRGRLAYPHFLELRARVASFDALEAHSGRTVAITDGNARAELVGAQRVSAGFLSMLGVEPQLGRAFSAPDDRPGAPAIVLISDDLWQRRYGGEEGILGRTVSLDARPHTIVGVMPPGFKYPGSSEIWTPLGASLQRGPLETAAVTVIGRVKAGIGAAQRDDELARLGEQTDSVPRAEGETVRVESRLLAASFIGGEERLVTLAMMGAVSFLLLLACANVASLLLVRAASREREFAVRAALGAGRARLIRQVLVESVLLAAMAGVVAVPFAWWGLRAFATTIPPSDPFPFYVTFSLSTPTLAYAFAVVLLTGVAFGLAPALSGSQAHPSTALRADGLSGMAPRRARTLSGLVVAEIALAMTLLVGASLFARTFLGLQNVELGYDPSRIMTMRFYLPGEKYAGAEARLRAVQEIADRLLAVPGVEHAAVSDLIPLEDDGGATARVEVDGAAPGAREQSLFYAGVTGEWLQTFGVDPIAGRDFEAVELRRGDAVAVINQTMAAAFWPGSVAVGRRFRFAADAARTWYTVIGVISDIRTVKLDEDETTPPTAFLPIQVLDTRDYGVMLRTAVPPVSVTNAARDAVAGADPDVPTYKLFTMEEVKWLSFWMYGLWGATFTIFGAIALLLAAIGVYAVISYGVKERRHEIGVRVALGATGGGVVGLVVQRGARLAGLGLAIGLLGAIALGRVVESLLIGVSASDPITYAGVVVFLGAVALAASLVPALRAAGLDAVVAMRR